MLSRDVFELSRNTFGYHASWAVWGPFGEKPKDNMDDLSMFDEHNIDATLKILHTDFVLVGLNISTSSIERPFANFHGKNGEVYKVRFAVHGTPLWGGYLTDILKDFPEPDSRRVELALKAHPELADAHLDAFANELHLLKADNAKLFAFGDLVFNLLCRRYTEQRVVQIPHYAWHRSKEVYKDRVQGITMADSAAL